MTKPATSKRGAAGRPTLQGEAMGSRSFRCSDMQWEKLQRLGGSQWIRDKLAEVPMPSSRGKK